MSKKENEQMSGRIGIKPFPIIPRIKNKGMERQMSREKRLYYLDNLKVFLIVLVIMHHVGQAYGTTGGGWFYAYPESASER